MNPTEKYFKACPIYLANGPQPDFELVYECLKYADEYDQPLPEQLIKQLLYNMKLFKNGWESDLLKKHTATKEAAHPIAEEIERGAVLYALLSTRYGLDRTPVKTVCINLRVGRSTYYRWKDKYSDVFETWNKVSTDMCFGGMELAEIRRRLLQDPAELYQAVRPK